MQRKNEIISHDSIYDTLWEYDEVSSDLALRTYIKNLRKLIGKEKIVSIKKLGYKFTTEWEKDTSTIFNTLSIFCTIDTAIYIGNLL